MAEPENRCPEAEARRIDRFLLHNRWMGRVLLFLCVVYFGGAAQLVESRSGRFVEAERRQLALVAYSLGVGLLLWAGACLARAKGRSALWGALGLGCLFGLIGLRFLPSRCLHCGRLESSRSLHCPDCRAPL